MSIIDSSLHVIFARVESILMTQDDYTVSFRSKITNHVPCLYAHGILKYMFLFDNNEKLTNYLMSITCTSGFMKLGVELTNFQYLNFLGWGEYPH